MDGSVAASDADGGEVGADMIESVHQLLDAMEEHQPARHQAEHELADVRQSSDEGLAPRDLGVG